MVGSLSLLGDCALILIHDDRHSCSSARTSFGREQCRIHTVCLQMDELLADERVEREEYRADVGYLFGTYSSRFQGKLFADHTLSCVSDVTLG